MRRILLAALRTGRVTEPAAQLAAPAPDACRGRPSLIGARCDGDGACAAACPSAAISLSPVAADGAKEWRLDYGACVFCGRCAEVCAPGALTITADYALAARKRDDLVLRVRVAVPLAATLRGDADAGS